MDDLTLSVAKEELDFYKNDADKYLRLYTEARETITQYEHLADDLHATIAAQEKEFNELKGVMNLTFLSSINGSYFLSVITGEDQNVHLVRVPKLTYLQMKKAGITEISKDILNEAR